MSDQTRIATSSALTSRASFARGNRRSSAANGAPKGYGEVDDLARRVNVLNTQDTPQNQASLSRLKRVLTSHQPLRGDVPRGFYLNIRV